MISNSGHDERGQYSGGAVGDQTGGEWKRVAWYNRPWSVVLRYPDSAVGITIATLAGEAADNDLIGYDQSQRATFWQALKAAGYYPALITTPCESDCSAGVAAIVKASGYILNNTRLQAVSADMYTGNEKAALTAAGFHALTESKYLSSDAYLKPGDILLYEGHHTAINLDTGAKSTMNNTDIKNSVAAVARRAKAEGWKYGDCHVIPPCPPIACDRGIFRALWDLSAKFCDQKKGGETVYTADAYLTSHGFVKNTDLSKVASNSIIFMKWNESAAFDWRDHMFYCVSYNHAAGTCNKYDFGEQWRINDGSYFENVKFNEWTTTPIRRHFYASYRLPDGGADYVFTPAAVKQGARGSSQYLANEILKAYDLKGLNKNGKPQSLELNDSWTNGDMAALTQWKLDRLRNGDVNLCKGSTGAGEIDNKTWISLLSSGLPFHAVTLPDREKHGASVLLWQRLMKANGYTGANGKPLTLDADWGDNTKAATIKWQKDKGRPQTGKVEFDDWKTALKGL